MSLVIRQCAKILCISVFFFNVRDVHLRTDSSSVAFPCIFSFVRRGGLREGWFVELFFWERQCWICLAKRARNAARFFGGVFFLGPVFTTLAFTLSWGFLLERFARKTRPGQMPRPGFLPVVSWWYLGVFVLSGLGWVRFILKLFWYKVVCPNPPWICVKKVVVWEWAQDGLGQSWFLGFLSL